MLYREEHSGDFVSRLPLSLDFRQTKVPQSSVRLIYLAGLSAINKSDPISHLVTPRRRLPISLGLDFLKSSPDIATGLAE